MTQKLHGNDSYKVEIPQQTEPKTSASLSREYASNPRASSHFRKRDRAQSIITLPEIPAGTAKPLETRPPLLDVIERCYTSRGEGSDERE